MAPLKITKKLSLDGQTQISERPIIDTNVWGIDTPEGKYEFINTILDSLRDDLLNKLDRVPAEWNGMELRHWIKYQIDTQVSYMPFNRRDNRCKRYKEFRNAIITKNL